MSFEEDKESFEHTLLVVREVSVFKIPPRSTSGGYKCGEWLQSDKIWSGRFRVVSCKDRCEIRLEDPNSAELFAACFVLPGQRESAVEPVLDSSRCFVLKIEDEQGKHAFIGLGFAERNEGSTALFIGGNCNGDVDKGRRQCVDCWGKRQCVGFLGEKVLL